MRKHLVKSVYLKEICDYLVEVELKIDLLCEKFRAQNVREDRKWHF